MTSSYLNAQEERFFLVEDYNYHGFDIQIDKKESTGEYYGKIYNSYEPYNLINSKVDKDIDNLKSILEDYAHGLIDDE
jgi:hypothetical protein